MIFRQSSQYAQELASVIGYYAEIDLSLTKRLFNRLLEMEAHLTVFPEAAPMASAPPVRKFIIQDFPIRIRYTITPSEIILLTLEHMKQDKPL
jgi:hypothetical protein